MKFERVSDREDSAFGIYEDFTERSESSMREEQENIKETEEQYKKQLQNDRTRELEEESDQLSNEVIAANKGLKAFLESEGISNYDVPGDVPDNSQSSLAYLKGFTNGILSGLTHDFHKIFDETRL
ncbi:hypothetical protein SNEBB_002339 [Seison nebaliae]|nr:hypothetical protein SNEBB_002339 [Seison nebaliae]